MLETEREVIVVTALPGVDPTSITTIKKNGVLEIFGRSVLPQGCFQRQLRIPPGTYGEVRTGTIANVLRYVTAPDGAHHLIAQGEQRFRVVEFL